MSSERERLLDAARKAAEHAHCIYSDFHVGAAVVADGKIFTGCNIENASYGLTICAERVAIFNAISAGAKKISAIAISCPDAGDTLPDDAHMPCGACRQVMSEFAEPGFTIFVEGIGDFTLNQLLFRPFRLLAEKP